MCEGEEFQACNLLALRSPASKLATTSYQAAPATVLDLAQTAVKRKSTYHLSQSNLSNDDKTGSGTGCQAMVEGDSVKDAEDSHNNHELNRVEDFAVMLPDLSWARLCSSSIWSRLLTIV